MLGDKFVGLIFSSKFSRLISRYKNNYLVRVLFVSIAATSYYLINGSFINAFVLFVGLDLYITDLYSNRTMAPAISIMTEKLHKIKVTDPESIIIKKHFLIINGIAFSGIVYTVFFF
ncbi:hypothetical protein [Marinomonas sp. PE14-40]|uniref:hypothetical protein n=1 Tax=Marinomonas sp. PE14-40 TaxID=3060621 RepID=UPI003F681545